MPAEAWPTRHPATSGHPKVHMSKYKPWRLVAYVAFLDKAKAEGFERYLKSGSGCAFANRHLWDSPRT